MYEKLKIDTTCYFCDVHLKGILLSVEAFTYLFGQADETQKKEMKVKYWLGNTCRYCHTAFCREHWAKKVKRHWYHGVDNTPCPNCGQPLKDSLIINPEPSAPMLALIEREIDKVVDQSYLTDRLKQSEGFGEFLKKQVNDIKDAIEAPLPKFKIPGKAPLLDFWPGCCTVCGVKTDQPDIYVRYSYRRESKYLGRVGGTEKHYEITISDIREHPVRYCTACNKAAHSLRDLITNTVKKVEGRICEARMKQLKTDYIYLVQTFEEIK